MLFELIKQDGKLTLLSYLFLQVGDAWAVNLMRFLSIMEKEMPHVCASTL